MGTRVIHVGQRVTKLQVKNRQLVAIDVDGEQRSAPCEDIGVIVIDHNPALSTTARTLAFLAAANVAVIFCSDRHLPESTLIPLNGVSTTPAVLEAQIAMSQPRKKRAWQQLVQGKIILQARNLSEAPAARARLLRLAETVRSGDPENHEAQAARIYWPLVLSGRRSARSSDGINSALDYGYALVRATLARAIAGVGVTASLGFFHRSRTNPFRLIDDLIEPLRPQVDSYVLGAADGLSGALTPEGKRFLVGFLSQYFRTTFDQRLVASCHTYALSVRSYIEGTADELTWPRPLPS